MKVTEKLFDYNSKFDKKNKLNRLNKVVDKNILDQIESGLTLELLEQITKDLPVFRYQTQITIHGLFSELQNSYSFGYKNLFQNKNKSIGVKWGAIDEAKRQELKKSLRFTDFRYTRNSTENYFQILKRVTPENYSAILSELKLKLDAIDTDLFIGSKQLFAAVGLFGEKYLVLRFNVNAIYQKNVSILLEKMGYSQKWINKQKEIEAAKDKARELKYEQAKIESQKAKDLIWNEAKKDTDYLNANFDKIENTFDPGLFVKPYLSFDKCIKFRVYLSIKHGKSIKVKSIVKEALKDALLVTEKDFDSMSAKIDKYGLKGVYKLKNKDVVKIENKKVQSAKVQRKDIFIVDYSDKAVAIFGNTKSIKNNLKSIGCRFNRFLTYKGEKQAGWILQASKKELLNQII